MDDYILLGLGELTSLITNIQISLWGTKVLIECVYDPTGIRLPYQLIFQDCHEIRWDVHDSEEIYELEADLIGISLGESDGRKPAVIHTDIFEISILYGTFTLQKITRDTQDNRMPIGKTINS